MTGLADRLPGPQLHKESTYYVGVRSTQQVR
jgi:hypothetical protein